MSETVFPANLLGLYWTS